MRARRPRKRPETLAAFHHSAAIEAAYRKRLDKMVAEMHQSVGYWLLAAYKNNEPIAAREERPGLRGSGLSGGLHAAPLALDDILPANALMRALKKLVKRWNDNFDKAAEDLAKYFAKSVAQRSDKQLQSILRRGGFSVKFTMTQPMRDVLNATIGQNIALIKSIPQQYLADVEGLTMRSVQTGRDMGFLSKELQKTYGVTKTRAALIARTQNNMATAAMHRVRQEQLGITKARWVHSHAGKTPRPTHLRNDGKLYEVSKGWFDPDPKVRRWIQPGELIHCKCFSKSVIPGLS
jgi:SPP1 gp7 family putative phage head morphogenesis protein